MRGVTTWIAAGFVTCAGAACGTRWVDFTQGRAAEAQLDRGLVVVYPGASSIPAEELSWWIGMQASRLDLAIEGVTWGVPGSGGNGADVARAAGLSEAARLLGYMQAYPMRPMTLIGYSAGALVALEAAKSLPVGAAVDRIILVSPDLSPDYDLSAALDRARLGIVSFWSPVDAQLGLHDLVNGTLDGYRGLSAAVVGFSSADPRVIQIAWSAETLLTGHYGLHFGYILSPLWFAVDVSPWIMTDVRIR